MRDATTAEIRRATVARSRRWNTNVSEPLDPTAASNPAFSRATFARISAGVAGALGTVGAAGAYGKPHPPIVPEDDASIDASRPALTYGDRSIGSYFARPKTSAARAGVVVVQAIWGIDAQLRDTVRRLARAGYAAIAPDLYTGLGAPSGDGASDFKPYRDVAAKLVDATVDADIAAALAYVRASLGNPAAKVGVTGFCMGGGIALRQTVDAPAFAAAAVFYGKVRYGTNGNEGPITPIALAYADEIAVPLLGSWGERDTSILAADVRALDTRLAAEKKPHDVKIYPEAGHAFFDDTRDSYVASAADDAWTRTLAWFARHLA